MTLWLSSENKVTIWSIEDKGKHAVINASSSRKDRATDQWVNSSWFMRFVGVAHDKVVKLGTGRLDKGVRVKLTSSFESKEPYMDKDEVKQFPKTGSIVVLDFELVEASATAGSARNMDAAPLVQADDENIPF